MKRGFTLIEVLVVIAILGILTALVFHVGGHPANTPTIITVTRNANLDEMQSNIQGLQVQVRELSCEVKGGVWKEKTDKVLWADLSVTYLTPDTCTKGGVEYTYQDGRWVSTKQVSL